MLFVRNSLNKLSRQQNLKTIQRKLFSDSSSVAPPQPKFVLKRPWHYNDDDYAMLVDQVHFVSGVDTLLELIDERRYDLNEVHLAYILQNMYDMRYMEFTEGN
jgi:hypothetical protein